MVLCGKENLHIDIEHNKVKSSRYSPTAIAYAIGGKPGKPLPIHTPIAGTGRLFMESFTLPEQMHTIGLTRLRGWVSRLDEQKMEEINQAPSISVGLSPVPFLWKGNLYG